MDSLCYLLENTEMEEDYEVFDEEYKECIICNKIFLCEKQEYFVCSMECYNDYKENS